jgi:hypothetical protein
VRLYEHYGFSVTAPSTTGDEQGTHTISDGKHFSVVQLVYYDDGQPMITMGGPVTCEIVRVPLIPPTAQIRCVCESSRYALFVCMHACSAHNVLVLAHITVSHKKTQRGLGNLATNWWQS